MDNLLEPHPSTIPAERFGREEGFERQNHFDRQDHFERQDNFDRRDHFVRDEGFAAPGRGVAYARTHIPSAAPGQFSALDAVAAFLIAVIMIGPLAAATLTRMLM